MNHATGKQSLQVRPAPAALYSAAKAGLPFIAFAFAQGIDGAEEAGRAIEDALASEKSVDPADPWRGLYSPERMPKLDGSNQYHVAHPDLPAWPNGEDEERGILPLISAQGFAVDAVHGEYPEDDDGEVVDCCAWLATWTPEAPAGEGWRIVCICDTEDGPAAYYVRPLALIDSQAVRNG